jgi:hypothetical protein
MVLTYDFNNHTVLIMENLGFYFWDTDTQNICMSIC